MTIRVQSLRKWGQSPTPHADRGCRSPSLGERPQEARRLPPGSLLRCGLLSIDRVSTKDLRFQCALGTGRDGAHVASALRPLRVTPGGCRVTRPGSAPGVGPRPRPPSRAPAGETTPSLPGSLPAGPVGSERGSLTRVCGPVGGPVDRPSAPSPWGPCPEGSPRGPSPGAGAQPGTCAHTPTGRSQGLSSVRSRAKACQRHAVLKNREPRGGRAWDTTSLKVSSFMFDFIS